MTQAWMRGFGLVALALALGLGIAGCGGYRAGRAEREAREWGASMALGFYLSQYAWTQYRNAEYGDARAALEAYLNYLNSMQPGSSDWQPGEHPLLDERLLAVEKVLTVGRLAVLEERRGATAEAAARWTEAERHARGARWRDATSENVKQFVRRVDAIGNRERGEADSGPPKP